jgi:hypothetical protein
LHEKNSSYSFLTTITHIFISLGLQYWFHKHAIQVNDEIEDSTGDTVYRADHPIMKTILEFNDHESQDYFREMRQVVFRPKKGETDDRFFNP